MAIPMSHVPTSIFSSVASHELVQTPSFPEDPSHILGRNTPKTIEHVVPVSGVFGDMKKIVEHCWTSLSSPCKTESITWNLHDKSSALIKFPIAKRASVFWTSIWHCPPPQSLSVFISWGNVELHSHEVRHPTKSTEALQKMPRKCQWWLQTHRQVAPGDPRSEGTEDTEVSLHSKGSTGYTGAVRVSKEKRWPNTRKPSRTVAMILQERILAQVRALVQNHLFLGGYGYGIPYSSGDPGRLAQSKPVACSSTEWLHLSIIRVNRSAEDRWNLSQHLHLHDWWYLGTSQGKTTSTQSKILK